MPQNAIRMQNADIRNSVRVNDARTKVKKEVRVAG